MKMNLKNHPLTTAIKDFGCEEIHIKRNAEGVVSAIAEDVKQGIKMFRILEKQTATEEVHFVLGSDIQKVLIKMSAETIKVTITENAITVQGEAKVKTSRLDKEAPVMEYLKKPEGALLIFKKEDILSKVSYLSTLAATNDTLRPTLMGIAMENKKGTVELSATDGFVGAFTEAAYILPTLPERTEEDDDKWEKIKEKVETQRTKSFTPFTEIAKASDLEKAIKLVDGNNVYVAVVPNKEIVVFTAINMVSMKPLAGKKLDIKSLIVTAPLDDALVIKETEVEKLVSVIPILESAVDHQPMILDNTGNGLGLYSKSQDGLRVFSQTIEIEDKKEMLVALNPKFLKRAVSIPDVKMYVSGEKNAVIFENGAIKGLILPINIANFNREDFKS